MTAITVAAHKGSKDINGNSVVSPSLCFQYQQLIDRQKRQYRSQFLKCLSSSRFHARGKGRKEVCEWRHTPCSPVAVYCRWELGIQQGSLYKYENSKKLFVPLSTSKELSAKVLVSILCTLILDPKLLEFTLKPPSFGFLIQGIPLEAAMWLKAGYWVKNILFQVWSCSALYPGRNGCILPRS